MEKANLFPKWQIPVRFRAGAPFSPSLPASSKPEISSMKSMWIREDEWRQNFQKMTAGIRKARLHPFDLRGRQPPAGTSRQCEEHARAISLFRRAPFN